MGVAPRRRDERRGRPRSFRREGENARGSSPYREDFTSRRCAETIGLVSGHQSFLKPLALILIFRDDRWTRNMSELEFFKKISTGGLARETLIQRLVDTGIRFNKYAEILFEHQSFSPSHQTEKVSLVKVKLSDLGLNGPCSFQNIANRASRLGLRLCPLYLGAFLRLEYLEQPEGPYLTIASPQPESDENYPTGFYIRNFENSLWLRGYRARGESEWPLENEFIFSE